MKALNLKILMMMMLLMMKLCLMILMDDDDADYELDELRIESQKICLMLIITRRIHLWQ